MTDEQDCELEDAEKNHFAKLLDELRTRGITQSQVASAAGVAPQYISDVRYNRRPLGELVARRISEHFHIEYAWVMGGDSDGPPPGLAAVRPAGIGGWLPVFPHPIEGDPLLHPRWEGSYVQVPPIATPRLALALHPYALRFRNDDVERRLHKNDLLLVSQHINVAAEISVVRFRNKCFLARHKDESWVRVANGQQLGHGCTTVGHCLGILWSALS